MSTQSGKADTGSSVFPTTALGLRRSTRSKSLVCSNDFTATIIQGPASDWPFANVLSNAITVESGSNPSPGKAHSSTSRSPADKEQPRRRLILVVDDNKADVFLIREALAAAHVDADLHVVHDGHAALRFLDAAD